MIKKNTIILLLCFFSYTAFGQQKISAEVEIKQMAKGKVLTVKKQLFYQKNGKLVVHYTQPKEYFMITNALGETKVYHPENNEVLIMNDEGGSSKNELLYYFLSNNYEDLGLKDLGFTVSSSKKEGKRLVKTYTSTIKNHDAISKIEMVYENFLPIYCAYFNKKQQIIRKIYYSDYQYFKQFTLPTRITEISYPNATDSIIHREIYSNIQLDKPDNLFDYEVPSQAKLAAPLKK